MRPSLAREVSFGLRFYLGLGAPGARRRYPECRTRAARGYSPDLVREILAARDGRSECAEVTPVNHRVGRVRVDELTERFFIKAFPWQRPVHDVERSLRISRADRAWRAAHLLPRLGIATPHAVGTASRREEGRTVEYLVTTWLAGSASFAAVLATAGREAPLRRALLCELAAQMRLWHSQAVYSRDLVKNVLVTDAGGGRRYWLTDLDGLHPIRRVNRTRVLFHLRQLAFWSGGLTPEEVDLVSAAYLGETADAWREAVERALATAVTAAPPPPEALPPAPL